MSKGPRFVSAPPKLQGLTVLGKIDIGGKKEKEKDKDKDKKRTRTRTRGKAIDINAEAARARNTSSTETATGTTPRTNTSQPENRAGSKRGRKGASVEVDRDQVNKQLRQTFSRMGDNTRSGRQQHSKNKRAAHEAREQARRDRESAEATILRVTEFVTVAELANLMNVDVSQVIGKCIGLGLMVSINQRLDRDTIQLVSDEFGFTVEFTEEFAEDSLADTEDAPETLKQRAPIVTIMGHVDHGKTSLLDHIRSANVVAGEAGGITQHIGAYSVTLPDKRKITFLDTPGHEAFTAMRARGAQVTDIVVLIVAADDAVMPQTLEAISHAQAANVPMIITINKIDKPDANPDRIKQQLADRGVLVEQWGGKYQCVEISARQGLNVDKLLDAILLEAEVLDLKANPDRQARGVVIESEIDRGKGVVATVLVQKGTLKVGDAFVAGHHYGRVRAMMDERGNRLHQVGPSEPAQILGFDGPPTAGDVIVVTENDRDAREIATRRQQVRREQEFKQGRHLTLDELSDQIARGGVQNLPLIIKGDVDGSVEALADALLRLSTPEVQVTVIMKSVGEISESDVLLATASNAIIIGFHVRPNLKARKLAEREGVEIRTYQIIYDTVNEVRAALEGMLKPEFKEVVTATVEVRDIFKISRVGTIAGCYVQDGKIIRSDKVRLLRDGLEVFAGTISSLRRLKDDVREVEQGYECGITLDGMNDIKQGDVIEAFKMVEVKRKLETAGTA
ncbi:MAG: translation initiation factor 2 [Chlorobi bacterium OLB7]|nr:MAG: translation initiation factor 2 [Chlorobi bacterium OLB7]